MSLALLRQFKTLAPRITQWHLRWLKRLGLAVVLLLVICALGWQFWLVPKLPQYKPWIEQQLSQKIGAPVRVGALEGGWRGIHPQLALLQFQLFDNKTFDHKTLDQQHAALEFSRLQGSLSWGHLFLGQIRFRHLLLDSPELDIRRLANGQWQVAGIVLDQRQSNQNNGQVLNWLLDQGELTIKRGRLRLNDQRGEFPALSADDVALHVSNWFDTHHAQLQFTPTQMAGKQVKLDAKLSGDDVNDFSLWSGWLRFDLPQADLSQLAPWLSSILPNLQIDSGQGALGLKLVLAEGKLEGIDADLRLNNWQIRLPQGKLQLPLFVGRIFWSDLAQQRRLQVKAERIGGAGGELCRDCELEYLSSPTSQTLTARRWQLAGLNAYSHLLPAALANYRQTHFQGEMNKLSLAWGGMWPFDAKAKPPSLDDLGVEAELSGFGWQNLADWPALKGLDLDLQLAPKGGRLKLAGQNVALVYPAQFLDVMRFSQLQTRIDWQRDAKQGWVFNLDGLKMLSPELALTAQGRYVWPGGKNLGQVDLTADIEHFAANRVFAYLPRVLTDEVLLWLKGGLLAGEAHRGQLIWRGDVAQFPYSKGSAAAKAGQFTIKTQARGVTINYGDDWPPITDVDGQLTIDGMALTVDAQRGQISGTKLHDVKVTIPDLEHQQHVLVDGKVQGKTADFLNYVNNSPVRLATKGFLDGLKAQGDGKLDLQLDIPVADVDKTKINGVYAFEANQLAFGGAIPLLEQARGAVSFTESGMKVLPATARALGGHVALQGETDAKGDLLLQLKGQADLAQTMGHYLPVLSSWTKGSTPFQAALQVNQKSFALNVSSDLQGAQLALPAPLGKAANQARPLRIRISSGNVASENGVPRLDFTYGKALQGGFLLPADTAALRGKLVLGSDNDAPAKPGSLVLDTKGIQLSGRWPKLELAQWLHLQSQSQPKTGNKLTMPNLTVSQLSFDLLNAGGNLFNDVRLSGALNEKGAQASFTSQQVSGDIQWQSANNQVNAQLGKLWLPFKRADESSSKFASQEQSGPPQVDGIESWLNLPALNLVAQDFRFKNIELGTLTIRSKPQSRGLDFDELSVRNADGLIALDGQWFKEAGLEQTQAKVNINSPNLGRLLKRLGYPEAMKGAPLQFSGDGQWQGSPWAANWATVSGKAELHVGAGQFSKLDAGAGRLVSILSLQALPRRLKLDFSDVFSDGLQFDEIVGNAVVEQGVARTSNLKINGPAAKINFTGEANFVSETQNLRVRIVPSIGGAVALGVGVVNPIAGLAALAAQTVMDNPLGELVAYEFLIEGSMNDPKIKKIGIKPENALTK
ncbi:YhdP family protein [Chitinibacter sp. S2-10]|uniref:YhdP family protein n=1 Tax=Chitinibacter sp. S2-10 TaxID=3373597 RepID=UPI003977D8DA